MLQRQSVAVYMSDSCTRVSRAVNVLLSTALSLLCTLLSALPTSFSFSMEAELSRTLALLDRLQRVLAYYRGWIHSLRGRLDVAFIEVSSLRARVQQLSAEQFNIGCNLNVRIQDLEDLTQERLDRHEQDLHALAVSLFWYRQLLACFAVLALQLLRVVCLHGCPGARP